MRGLHCTGIQKLVKPENTYDSNLILQMIIFWTNQWEAISIKMTTLTNGNLIKVIVSPCESLVLFALFHGHHHHYHHRHSHHNPY